MTTVYDHDPEDLGPASDSVRPRKKPGRIVTARSVFRTLGLLAVELLAVYAVLLVLRYAGLFP